MSEIGEGEDLDEVLKGKKRAYVLFYASWCPFSRKFLPIFQKYASDMPGSCLSVKIDDNERLCQEYSIEVYPTLLLFIDAKVSKRLDGSPGAGLDERKLRAFIEETRP
jgi:thiol-disulfide isomerase/thioredoxin